MNQKEIIRQWMQSVLNATGWSAAEWARRAGTSPSNVTRLLARDEASIPRIETLLKLTAIIPAEADVEPLPFLRGAGAADIVPTAALSPPSVADGIEIHSVSGVEYAFLPRYDIGVSAGPGALVENDGAPMGYHPFDLQWLRSLTRSTVDRLAMVQVRGDSMWTTLHDGDQVLVDLARPHYCGDGIYVLDIGHGLQVKRVSMHPVRKVVTVSSDNTAYPSWGDLNPDDLRIIGRVIWIGRRT